VNVKLSEVVDRRHPEHAIGTVFGVKMLWSVKTEAGQK